MKYTFYDDPGHGWLEVPMTELVEMEIADKISTCSYRGGDYAYLEEDYDMTTFLRAKLHFSNTPGGWKNAQDWWTDNVKENDTATRTHAPEIFIRKLASYWH